MSHPQPQWLHSCLQDSHLGFAIRTLDSREAQREAARAVRSTSPPSSRARTSLPHPSRPPVPSQLLDHFSASVGQHPAHKRANRYLALEPYNRTRVLVPNPDHTGHTAGDTSVPTAGQSDTRYLNANWVRETVGGKWWIAGQAPLPNTAHAFLTLGMCPTTPPSSEVSPPLQPRRVHTIVQLTQLVEVGRRRAHPYFSSVPRQDMVIKPEPGCNARPIYVRVASEENVESAQCVKTELRLRWQSDDAEEGMGAEEWGVTHLLYNGWPDFGVPKDNHSIVNFARLVERINNRPPSHHSGNPNASGSPPILVHCSAGVGRTGSFVTLCSILRAYSLLSSTNIPPSNRAPSLARPLPVSPLGPLPDALSDDLVAQEIDGLREQRTSMVQKEEQVIWVYEALSDAFDGM